MSRTIIGAGAELKRLDDPRLGGVILSEAARMPAARIATAKAVNAIDKAMQKPLGGLPQKAGAIAGAKAGENCKE
jgi:hypothetical protein